MPTSLSRMFLWLAAVLSPSLAAAAIVPSVFDGRIPCAVQDGVQFCQGTLSTRVETFDGVPLDVNVTLPPASMDGPFPLIVDMHGWSLFKTGAPYGAWANAGYAVLSYTARGFHGSCGSAESRMPDATLANPNVCEERGWIRLSDVRYEAHDTQHLAGLLVDDGLVLPTKIGVTGASYGGGQSMILAALRNRVMQGDGTLVPWKSPKGTDMEIAAAVPLIPWSDLAYSLTPNGRTLDYRVANPYGRRGGVQKLTWNAALYNVGLSTGFYAPPGTDFDADITAWNARVLAGEPYEGDPTLEAILDEITAHHSAYYVDDTVTPAPLFISNAWTDDLFPADETIRFWRKTVTKHPDAEIALLYADDFGHPRASLGFGGAFVVEKTNAFFARHLKGVGDARPPVEVYTQACNGAAIEGPFTADDWDALHPGEVRYTSKKTQRFDGTGGSAANAAATDPLNGPPCRTVSAEDDANAATYRLPAARGDGYTLLGSPTVVADLAVTGPNAQIAARLWDVAPDGMQTLVAHTLYRPRSDNRGPQVFQLHPNGWRFADGHVPKLELLGQSNGYGRPSNGVFTVTVSRLELRLPVRETPGGKVVKTPADPVLPPEQVEPVGCALVPRDDCAAGTATLAVGTGKAAAKSRLAWRWRATGTTPAFGDPTAATDYALCIYDATPTLVGSVVAPAGGTCGKKPCWKADGAGFAFAAGGRPATGVRKVTLAPGNGATTCGVAAGGPLAGVPALTTGATVTTQLVGSDGSCWSAALTPRKASAR